MMQKILNAIGRRRPQALSDAMYRQAMSSSSDLVRRLRHPPPEIEAARSISASVWARARNIPVLVTVYEAMQEMKAATHRDPG